MYITNNAHEVISADLMREIGVRARRCFCVDRSARISILEWMIDESYSIHGWRNTLGNQILVIRRDSSVNYRILITS